MHHDLRFRAATEPDLTALGDVLSHGFGFPEEDAPLWFSRAGLENIRILERGDRTLGGLIVIPMGQFFGGRSVSTLGVAGVGVVCEERGRGVAAHMMVSMLREARAREFALSTLYPASITLYRRVGYERAGGIYTVTIDPRTCEIARVPGMSITEVSGTPDEVMSLYRQVAQRSPGYMDRGPYIWSRVSKPRGLVTKTFTFSHAETKGLEGYVVVSHAAGAAPLETVVTVTDLAAVTPRAARAILRLLVEYRSLATTLKWKGGPSDVFTNALPERHVRVELADYFMIRVVDMERAMAMRGWPRHASGTVVFELDDTSMPENSGRYRITLEEGRARIESNVGASGGGGSGSGSGSAAPVVKIGERGLAALYTGHAQPHVLTSLGLLEASEDASHLLESWFGGAYPTMRDFF